MSVTQQQPGEKEGMSIQGGNRNAKNLPMDDGERGWSNGLCSCFDECGTCCLAMWCPCILYSKVKHRYDHLERKGFPDPEHGGGVCTGFCMLYAAMAWIASPCVLQCLNRGDVRRRYNIKGNGCTDCLTACFCHTCELVQESREIELEEQSYGGA